ncbi:MAG: hypothetical protein J7604_25900 [Sporocytophaga sp.]|uniref:hypothetical protein n=1 Tax=Sporocytophaga sp. TaxID=2231183 RepID=UPI001B1A9D8F|nr:hypothetical protein [Sporocytophaga sp.]MBO9703665.1 hypothetical protein [Sporocytophaga sp.]
MKNTKVKSLNQKQLKKEIHSKGIITITNNVPGICDDEIEITPINSTEYRIVIKTVEPQYPITCVADEPAHIIDYCYALLADLAEAREAYHRKGLEFPYFFSIPVSIQDEINNLITELMKVCAKQVGWGPGNQKLSRDKKMEL